VQEDFRDAVEFVLEQEGGYTLDPNDPGGETKFGISKKAYPNLDIKNLTREDAIEIYQRDYWKPCRCDDLPRHFAFIVFDSAVNQGPRVAIRLLQIALGVSVDGIIGPKTLAAASSAKPRAIRLALAERLAAYSRLMAEKPNLLVFARNWSFRVLSLAKKVDV
jgi:lysozyme family protein